MKHEGNPEIPAWLIVASQEIIAIMQSWGCPSLSSLHKEGLLTYKTLKKLDPDALDPTLALPTVQEMLAKLYVVASASLDGDRRQLVQQKLTTALMKVSSAAVTLSEDDREKIGKRKRMRQRRLY